jgi:hypothetical protein
MEACLQKYVEKEDMDRIRKRLDDVDKDHDLLIVIRTEIRMQFENSNLQLSAIGKRRTDIN